MFLKKYFIKIVSENMKKLPKKQDTLAEFLSFQKFSLTAQQPKTAESVFSNVAYRATVYITGEFAPVNCYGCFLFFLTCSCYKCTC